MEIAACGETWLSTSVCKTLNDADDVYLTMTYWLYCKLDFNYICSYLFCLHVIHRLGTNRLGHYLYIPESCPSFASPNCICFGVLLGVSFQDDGCIWRQHSLTVLCRPPTVCTVTRIRDDYSTNIEHAPQAITRIYCNGDRTPMNLSSVRWW